MPIIGPTNSVSWIYINSYFMNIFLTGSPNTDIACQVNFGFFTKYKIFIRAAKFRQKFVASENSLCTLFVSDPHQQLHGIFVQFGKQYSNSMSVVQCRL